MWEPLLLENRGESGSLALVNKLHVENVMQYIVFGFNIERDLSSDRRSETLSLRERSAEFQTRFVERPKTLS
ncbi:hypothetical protein APS47_05945 [Leptospira kirschneri serovar Mozdok]|nr:hypothetical protein APS47_05945 [Leptospira kirschneri serovar Mozdok]